MRRGYRSQQGLAASRVLVIGAALLACAGTARLGLWQLDRAAQKTSLQQQVDQRAKQPALTNADLRSATPASITTLLQRPVQLRGTWRSEATVYLDNRPMAGRAGFIVLTPLVLADNSAIAVQRGWLPRDMSDRTRLPPLTTPSGEVEVTGRLAAWPSAMYDMGEVQEGRIRQNLSQDELARSSGLTLLSASVLMSEPVDSDGLLRQWPAPAVDVQKHYGYAAQWFGLSALIAGLALWFQAIQPWRQSQRRRASSATTSATTTAAPSAATTTDTRP